jgi:hypothetical protein
MPLASNERLGDSRSDAVEAVTRWESFRRGGERVLILVASLGSAAVLPSGCSTADAELGHGTADEDGPSDSGTCPPNDAICRVTDSGARNDATRSDGNPNDGRPNDLGSNDLGPNDVGPNDGTPNDLGLDDLNP